LRSNLAVEPRLQPTDLSAHADRSV